MTKKSSKTVFLLYAVIWGLSVPLLTGGRPYAWAQEPSPRIEEVIATLEDPFDVQVRAPEVVDLFLNGLAELKKQIELRERPPEEKIVEPVAVPLVQPVSPAAQEPVKPKKIEIPEMKISGIVYNTDRPQAIINGKVVGVGSDINGVSILKIEKGRIEARFQGADITLKFNNE